MKNKNVFKSLLNQSKRTVFFSGAGAPTESGIPDFRSSIGIFSKKLNKNIPPEKLVSRAFFNNHPQEFFDFYYNTVKISSYREK